MDLTVYSFRDSVDYLNWVYLTRKRKNASFSLRSWARSLRINHAATLSAILRRKQKLNPALCKRLVKNLALSEEEAEYFQLVTLYSYEKDGETKDWLRSRVIEKAPDNYPTIAVETLKVIADWKKILLLEYLSSSKFNPRTDILKTKFGDILSRREIESSIDTFEKLGLVKRTADGKVHKTTRKFTTPADIPSTELRNLQKNFFSLAIQAMDVCPIPEREMSTALVVTSKKKITEAKKRLRKLRRELADLLKDDDGDTVYALNVGLFEVLEERTCAH